jgi:hypothetical protein
MLVAEHEPQRPPDLYIRGRAGRSPPISPRSLNAIISIRLSACQKRSLVMRNFWLSIAGAGRTMLASLIEGDTDPHFIPPDYPAELPLPVGL